MSVSKRDVLTHNTESWGKNYLMKFHYFNRNIGIGSSYPEEVPRYPLNTIPNHFAQIQTVSSVLVSDGGRTGRAQVPCGWWDDRGNPCQSIPWLKALTERKQTPHLSPSHPTSQGGSHDTLIPEKHPSTQPTAWLTITWEQERVGDNWQVTAPEAVEGSV